MAEGNGLKEAEISAETDLPISTRDSERNQLYNEQDKVTVKVWSSASEDEETKMKDSVKMNQYSALQA